MQNNYKNKLKKNSLNLRRRIQVFNLNNKLKLAQAQIEVKL